MKKSTCMDINEQRQYRPMKLFNESQEVNVDKPTIETGIQLLLLYVMIFFNILKIITYFRQWHT